MQQLGGPGRACQLSSPTVRAKDPDQPGEEGG